MKLPWKQLGSILLVLAIGVGLADNHDDPSSGSTTAAAGELTRPAAQPWPGAGPWGVNTSRRACSRPARGELLVRNATLGRSGWPLPMHVAMMFPTSGQAVSCPGAIGGRVLLIRESLVQRLADECSTLRASTVATVRKYFDVLMLNRILFPVSGFDGPLGLSNTARRVVRKKSADVR